jgi:hypothetical protein
MAADEGRVLMLLPGRKSGDRVIMFHEMNESDYMPPINLIAEFSQRLHNLQQTLVT